jgi:hypothetical protein
MIDFNNLRKPDARTTPTDPREIFKRRPSGEGVANDLWRGQAEALEGWFKDQKDETLILLNHIEWLKTHYPNTKLNGLIFLTDAQKISDKSDPSEMMYFGTQAQLLRVWEEFFTAIDRIKTLSPIEKLAEANKVGTLPEWNPEGIFRRLIAKSCKS